MEKAKIIALVFFNLCIVCAAASITPDQPQQVISFHPSLAQTARSCPYTVIIRTSCSSRPYTRDKVSIAFGDTYGNEVYVKRLDDPYSRTFEKCSTDEFQINGPCMKDICYLYLLWQGSDGWKPESVKVYGRYTRAVNFYYNEFLPNGIWYGYNMCNAVSASQVM